MNTPSPVAGEKSLNSENHQSHLAAPRTERATVSTPHGITYHAGTGRYAVFCHRRLVGHIRLLQGGKGGFRYFPLGAKTGGEKFKSLAECKQSLEAA